MRDLTYINAGKTQGTWPVGSVDFCLRVISLVCYATKPMNSSHIKVFKGEKNENVKKSNL